MTYKVIIVDLDDTVLDFKAGEVKGLATVLKHFRRQQLTMRLGSQLIARLIIASGEKLRLVQPHNPY